MDITRRHHIIFLAVVCLIFFIMSSCTNNSNLFMSGIAVKSRVKPDVEIMLSSYETITSDALVNARSIVAKIDSFLVFSTASDDYSFIVYNEFSDSIVLMFPNKGRGPDEQIFSIISQIRRNNESVEIDVLGLNEHSVLTIDFYHSIEQHVDIIRKTELPPNTMYTHSFGEKIAGIVLFDEYDYTLQIFDAESMEREDLMLPFGLSVDPGFITSTCVMKEDGTKCLWAMQWANKFNILDLGNLDKSASYSTSRRKISDKQLYAGISEMPPASVPVYYSAARVTNDDIYLLFRGFSNEDMDKQNQMEIQNFSWEGHFKYRYLITDIIDSFIVSDDSSTIYGYSWDESKVYKYSLNH